MTRKSKCLHHLIDVLHFGRRRKTVGDVLAPFLEIGRAAKINSVVLDRLPFDEQPVAARFLDRALQFQALAALGTLEYRRGVFHAGFEFGFHAGLDVDLGDFGDHVFWLPEDLRLCDYEATRPRGAVAAGGCAPWPRWSRSVGPE